MGKRRIVVCGAKAKAWGGELSCVKIYVFCAVALQSVHGCNELTTRPSRLQKFLTQRCEMGTTDKDIKSGKGLHSLSTKWQFQCEIVSVKITNILNFPHLQFHNERVVFGSLGRPITN